MIKAKYIILILQQVAIIHLLPQITTGVPTPTYRFFNCVQILDHRLFDWTVFPGSITTKIVIYNNCLDSGITVTPYGSTKLLFRYSKSYGIIPKKGKYRVTDLFIDVQDRTPDFFPVGDSFRLYILPRISKAFSASLHFNDYHIQDLDFQIFIKASNCNLKVVQDTLFSNKFCSKQKESKKYFTTNKSYFRILSDSLEGSFYCDKETVETTTKKNNLYSANYNFYLQNIDSTVIRIDSILFQQKKLDLESFYLDSKHFKEISCKFYHKNFKNVPAANIYRKLNIYYTKPNGLKYKLQTKIKFE